MIIYVPNIVSGEEQIDSLPRDTPVLIGPFVAIRRTEDRYWTVTLYDAEFTTAELTNSFPDYSYVALVPTEAEECLGSEMLDPLTDLTPRTHVLGSLDMKNAQWQIENNPKYSTGRIMRQYRTTWEEV